MSIVYLWIYSYDYSNTLSWTQALVSSTLLRTRRSRTILIHSPTFCPVPRHPVEALPPQHHVAPLQASQDRARRGWRQEGAERVSISSQNCKTEPWPLWLLQPHRNSLTELLTVVLSSPQNIILECSGTQDTQEVQSALHRGCRPST